MRKRLTLVWLPLLMAAALVLPTNVLGAASIFYRSISIGCPAYPDTQIDMVLRFVAKANSGADRMKVRGWVSQSSDGISWTKIYKWPQIDYSWVPDGTRHYIDIDRHWTDSPNAYEKIVVHLQAYAGDEILWGGKVHTGKC